MDPDKIEPAVTPKTKALLPVHLNGRVCNMDRIMSIAEEHNLIIIEDAAQALGATFRGIRAGSFGRTGCFSFYPFKALGGFGDGGAITTNDEEIARKAILLRYNGEDRETGEYHFHGQTALLDNVQAAVLGVKLRYFDEWVKHRRSIAQLYGKELTGVDGLLLPHFNEDGYHDVYQNYVVRTKYRDALRKSVKANGIETLVHWPKPMWQHKGLGLENPGLPETEAICREVISLPMSAETTPEQVQCVADCVREFFAKQGEQALQAGYTV
jgi:dTDP-4-amino-4,6-dideoxygalactose transaminase